MRPASLRRGLWHLADPKISLASFAGMFLGASAAAAEGPLHAGWLALTVLGIFAVEVAKNASGEIVDFDSGADQAVAQVDRSPFSGGKRVLVDGLLTRRQTAIIALVAYGLAIGIGLFIVLAREPAVFLFGVAGLILAYGYHAAPLRLSYHGLGEAAVAVAYGPLVCAGTWLVERGTVPERVWALTVPLGLLVAAFLWINEVPDCDSDHRVGKLNLVARLGRRRASRLFPAWIALALLAVFVLPHFGWPRVTWLAAIAVVPAGFAARTLWRFWDSTPRIVSAQRATLLAFITYALVAGLTLD